MPIHRTKTCGVVTAMNRFNALKHVRREIGVAERVPITHLNEPTVFEGHHGMLGMVLQIKGVTFNTELDETLNQYQLTWHRALTALDERFCVYVTVHRHQENTVLSGTFDKPFARELDATYHQQFKDSALYTNTIYLTVLYKGITSGGIGKGLHLLQRLSHKAIKQAREHTRREQIKQLKAAVYQLMTSLSVFKPRLLGLNDRALGHSELLSFFGLLINGGATQPFPWAAYAAPIRGDLAQALKADVQYPEGNIAQYLSTKRLFFGDVIQFQGSTTNDTRFGAIVTVKRYGTETASVMLDPLLHLDGDFISTHSFAVEAKDTVQERIRRHMAKMENVNDPAVSQIDALHEARDQIASDQITMGYHHNTVLLLAATKPALEKAVAHTIKCYADAGSVAVKETLGQEPAFWAQIPMNINYIARSSLVTSQNFVDFCSLHNYRTGYRDGNHLGSAVTLLETPSKTPYFFNYHVRGSRDNPSKGHTLIIGGNGSGKTAFMCFMDAQLGRYGGASFYFDRDRGAEIYVRASGGSYAVLSPDFPETTCFNPLQLADTPTNRQFNRELLTQLCKNEGESELDADVIEALKRCVDYAYDQLSPEFRTLTHATKILPIQFPRWANLRRWLNGQGSATDGDYAYLFDNDVDQLTLQCSMGFDLTHFLDREPTTVRTALMMYLCQRIEEALTGQLVRIYFDEGWQNLIDPYWKAKFQRWLPTLRKRNGMIVLSTQSPSSVIHSPLRGVMLDNVATQVFFANPQAQREEYVEGFRLTASEFEAIANNPPESRLFLVKQEHDSTLCRLNLGQLPDALAVLSGNTATVQLLDTLRREVGEDPQDWLPLFYQRRLELRT